MSFWGEGYLTHGRVGVPPRKRWSDLLLFQAVLWAHSFAVTISSVLFLLITFSPTVAHATENDSEGTGLFALSLEEVLDINVNATDHYTHSRDGVFALTSHELLRIYKQSEQVEVSSYNAPGSFGEGAFPVLIQGNYLGTFRDVRSALRFIQQISGKEVRVDLYKGGSTVWFEKGRYQVLFDIQSGINPTLLEQDDNAVAGSGPVSVDDDTEVLP